MRWYVVLLSILIYLDVQAKTNEGVDSCIIKGWKYVLEMANLNTAHFYAVSKDTVAPSDNYQLQKIAYQTEQLQDHTLLHLSLKAIQHKDDSLALEIAKKYKKLVINRSKPEKILTPEFGEFLVNFRILFSLKENVIQYINRNRSNADKLFNNTGLSKKIYEYLITKDIILSEIKPNGVYFKNEPDWRKIDFKVKKQSDAETARRLIFNAKIRMYAEKKDWTNYIKYKIIEIESKPIDTAGFAGVALNNFAYDVIFKHSNDRYAIGKAIKYMTILLQNDSLVDSRIDTYANLLYKAGRKEEALIQEKRALQIAFDRKDADLIKEYSIVISKIEKNIPTWVME
jgi:hypothetical protein